MDQLEIYIDGASKGNPGPAGIGVVICQKEQVVKNLSSYIGETTNNVAEYTALIYALEEALVLKAKSIKISTDSQLVYRQIKKEYKVKDPRMQELCARALRLMSAFRSSEIIHIPRELNSGADKLATLAIKNAIKRKA